MREGGINMRSKHTGRESAEVRVDAGNLRSAVLLSSNEDQGTPKISHHVGVL